MESQSYFNCGRRAAFHPVVIVVSSLDALDQIDAKKHKNVPRKTYSFLKVKLRRQSLKKSWTKINMILVQRTVLANSSIQIAGPGVTCGVTI